MLDRESEANHNLNRLCVPGIGMILWGESPLCIVWRVVIIIDHLKSDEYVIFKVDQAFLPGFACPNTIRHFW
jgi:hypothetical protein